MSKLTLLRRIAEGEDIEAADQAIERMATDDEIKATYRDPARWSYVVRDPTGAIVGEAAFDTQEACLHDALDAVAVAMSEDFLDKLATYGWRFLLWPPELAGHPKANTN